MKTLQPLLQTQCGAHLAPERTDQSRKDEPLDGRAFNAKYSGTYISRPSSQRTHEISLEDALIQLRAGHLKVQVLELQAEPNVWNRVHQSNISPSKRLYILHLPCVAEPSYNAR